MVDATALKNPVKETEAEVITLEIAARRRVQAAVYKVEYLIEIKKFSPERLWRGFFGNLAKEFGSIAEVVKLMQANGDANADIFRLLKLSGYSDKEVFGILEAAGWTDVQIISARFWLKEDSSSTEDCIVQADLDALDFLFYVGLNKARIVSTLFKTDCLNRRTTNRLIACGWTWQDFFQALVEAKCFNIKTCQMLLGFKDKQKKAMFDDGKFLILMSELKIPDSNQILLFNGAGKTLSQVYKLYLAAGWTEERLIIALIEAGYPPGIIACAYAGYAFEKIDEKEKQMEQNIKGYTDIQIDAELPKIAAAIEGEKNAVKAKIIAMLQKMVVGDREVVVQLLNQEWTNMRIIDLLSAVGWTPERAINALLVAGKNEFSITNALNELAEDYEFKGNNYWEYDRVRLWKDTLRKIFSAREIAFAIEI